MNVSYVKVYYIFLEIVAQSNMWYNNPVDEWSIPFIELKGIIFTLVCQNKN